MIDTLTSAPGRIVAGAVPVAAAELPNATMHNIGAQLVTYAGALLASTIVHLGLTLINKLKKKYSKSYGNPTEVNPQTEINKS